MNESNINFPSRISARAIVAANFSVFSLMILLMSLAGVFNLWSVTDSKLSHSGTPFWTWTLLSWTICLGLSSYLSALLSRATQVEDGVLHGLITWASSNIFAYSILFMMLMTGIISGRGISQAFILSVFITNIVSLCISLMTGFWGTRAEKAMNVYREDLREFLRIEQSNIAIGD